MNAADYETMLRTVAQRDLGALGVALGQAFDAHLHAAGIEPPLRLAHFVAQIAEETGGFQWMHELGNEAYFARYDGRADLGNGAPGDGYRFRGRGLIMLTGRANYEAYGAQLNLNLWGDPDLAMEPDAATQIAVAYWTNHGLNALADADDIEGITRKVNGGLTGLAMREAYLARARAYIITAQA